MTRETRITEKTLIPVSLVIAMIGGISWLTTIYYKTEANAASLLQYTKTLDSIDQRLSHIEGRLGVGDK